jgi:hypothetical protein
MAKKKATTSKAALAKAGDREVQGTLKGTVTKATKALIHLGDEYAAALAARQQALTTELEAKERLRVMMKKQKCHSFSLSNGRPCRLEHEAAKDVVKLGPASKAKED